ncbi:hypothetical protein RN001_007946 [Aquatica leii]|uniref:Uncharacterized protein n=1 Tax=Aquatica leii TaxID=1421715 RepID=A0AAN7Q4Q9_9COLE|nr:hypothetical protein RN001_007946 [Aquatica leii]
MEVKDTFTTHRPYLLNRVAQKSVSSIGLCEGTQNLSLREAKSFTGAIEELKINAIKENNHGEMMNCHDELYIDDSLLGNHINERGYETREVLSNQIFLVRDEMLTYRGKRYSLSDIATKWKKDCRMWLWKSDKPKIKSLRELREKLQNIKIQ